MLVFIHLFCLILPYLEVIMAEHMMLIGEANLRLMKVRYQWFKYLCEIEGALCVSSAEDLTKMRKVLEGYIDSVCLEYDLVMEMMIKYEVDDSNDSKVDISDIFPKSQEAINRIRDRVRYLNKRKGAEEKVSRLISGSQLPVVPLYSATPEAVVINNLAGDIESVPMVIVDDSPEENLVSAGDTHSEVYLMSNLTDSFELLPMELEDDSHDEKLVCEETTVDSYLVVLDPHVESDEHLVSTEHLACDMIHCVSPFIVEDGINSDSFFVKTQLCTFEATSLGDLTLSLKGREPLLRDLLKPFDRSDEDSCLYDDTFYWWIEGFT